MSYILDALKRANSERERERGTVPGLHSQPVLPPSAQNGDDPRFWWFLGGGALVLMLAGFAWYQFGPALQISARPSTQALPPRTAPVPPSPGVAPLPPPAITAITAVPAAEAPTPPQAGAATHNAPDGPASPTTSVVEQANAARRAAAREAAAARAEAPPDARTDAKLEPRATAQAETRPATPTPNTVLPTPAEPVYSFNDLPASVRSEIPALVIGGSSYSTNPKFRLLMINGQMYQERDKPLPNLVLEQINPKSAVLNYKGYRYRISY